MRRISRIFLTGLVTLLPIAITIYILYAVITSLERGLGNLLPEKIYRPGMGLLSGVVIVFLIGLLLHAYVFRRLFVYGERLMQRIPVVSTIYGAVRDLMGFLSSESKNKTASQTVLVALGQTRLRLLGFVTREDLSGLPAGMGDKETVAVYFPMSYQIGGFTAMVPRSALQPVDLSFQDGMRFAMTAGMSSGADKEDDQDPMP
ncbi:MAG: DUF502 domain-containing protein [Candidatus Sumerlaeia bacterium]|nr:DUF502 domain-containing protein [Candidatus Sumerlaeia bacterium]